MTTPQLTDEQIDGDPKKRPDGAHVALKECASAFVSCAIHSQHAISLAKYVLALEKRVRALLAQPSVAPPAPGGDWLVKAKTLAIAHGDARIRAAFGNAQEEEVAAAWVDLCAHLAKGTPGEAIQTMRAALQGLVDFHTKPAGLGIERIRDKKLFKQAMADIEGREKALVAAALAALQSTQAQGQDAAPAEQVQTDAARDVLAERQRQTEKEGWTPEHDDEHEGGSLAKAAACYALHAAGRDAWSAQSYQAARPPTDGPSDEGTLWPWDREWWKPKSPRRDLVRAGALILAEIERIDRAARAKE